MIWLVWRRQRLALLVALTLVALVAVAAVAGRGIALARADALGLTHCLLGADDVLCQGWTWSAYYTGYSIFIDRLSLAMIVVTGLAGAIAGAGLFGAELAQGSHVFALTQSVSRLRWWLTGLLVAGVPVAAAVALVTPTIGWATAPLAALYGHSPVQPSEFLTSGVVPAVYSVLAFSVAAGAGLLLRNVVGALGVALALQVAVLVCTTLVLRPGYLPPARSDIALPPPGQGDPRWSAPSDGLPLDNGYLDAAGREIRIQDSSLDCTGIDVFSDCLRANGFTGLYTTYQPADRYWPFQAIESGLVAALVAAALAAGLVGLRRRVH